VALAGGAVVIIDLRTIARTLGGEVVGNQALVPGPGHSRKDRSLSIRQSATAPEGFLAFSHAGDDFGECRDYIKQALGIASDTRRPIASKPARPAHVSPTQDDEFRQRIVASILREIIPLKGTPGEAYLRDARKIDTAGIGDVIERADAIGWHPSVLFREGGHRYDGRRLGAIIAVMTDAITAKPTGGISRTYVHEGEKVTKARGLGPAGVVRLSPDEDVLGGLHIAEGLETALAAMSIGFRPMWSVGSTAIMSKFPVVSGIEAITVLADNDANGAGEAAARELQARWEAAEREVRVWKPKSRGDLNDLLIQGGAR
jgi:putative DNA primase/helicase